jgi:uncharacterized membrane protein YkvA (DUF1232 family)
MPPVLSPAAGESSMKAARLGGRIVRGAFFARLMTRALELLKDPDKLRALVQSAGTKAEGARASDALKEIWETLMAFLRLLRAYVRGDYRNVPFKSLLLIIASVLYFVVPVDVIPDFVFGLGFLDDAAVLAWVFSVVREVVDDFTAWEALQPGA